MPTSLKILSGSITNRITIKIKIRIRIRITIA